MPPPSAAFTDEARENVAALEAGLLALETTDDGDLGDVIASLFRSAHNLKGMAAMEGLDHLSTLAHRLEAVLDDHRRPQPTRPDTATVDVLLRGADALGTLVDAAEQDVDPPETAEVVAALDAARTGGAEPATAPAPPPHHDGEPEPLPDGATGTVAVTLEDGARLPGARATVLVRRSGAVAEVLGTAPPLEQIRARELRSFALVVGECADPDALAAMVRSLPDVADATWRAASPAQPDAADPGPPQAPRTPPTTTIRVDVARLDELTDRLGELVVDRNRLAVGVDARGDRALGDALRRLDRTLADVQRAVMSVRLVSLEATADRLRRLVRDVARELGRDVRLDIEGEHTEIDRSMVDEMVTPLVHLLRNAVDHGIEAPEARLAAGKPTQGLISLRAYHQGRQVVIEVADDGAGIDLERVAAKAVRLGLLAEEDVPARSSEELLELMFNSGFSTREEVSEISGRGVGLDVVRSGVTRLGGQLDVTSERGTGTTFRVRLPLSLAVLDALLVRVADQIWAVPVNAASETARLDRLVGGVGAVPRSARHQGRLVPIIDGNERLAGLEPTTRGAPTGDHRHPAVIFDDMGGRFALVVDELIGSREIVVKSVPAGLGGLEHLAGATILDDGTVAMIVDLAPLARAWRLRHGRPAEIRAPGAAPRAVGPHDALPDGLASASRALGVLVGAEAVIDHWHPARPGADHDSPVVSVELDGAHQGIVHLVFSGHRALLSSQGVPAEAQRDALGEWANVVVGQLVVAMAERTEERWGIGPPRHGTADGDPADGADASAVLRAGDVSVDLHLHLIPAPPGQGDGSLDADGLTQIES